MAAWADREKVPRGRRAGSGLDEALGRLCLIFFLSGLSQ